MLIQNLSHHNCIPAIERMETKYSYSYDTNQSQLAIGMAFQLQQTAVYRPRISENHSQNFPCLIGKFGLRVWNKYIERTQFIMRLSTRKVFRSYNVRGLSFHSFRRLHFVNWVGLINLRWTNCTLHRFAAASASFLYIRFISSRRLNKILTSFWSHNCHKNVKWNKIIRQWKRPKNRYFFIE